MRMLTHRGFAAAEQTDVRRTWGRSEGPEAGKDEEVSPPGRLLARPYTSGPWLGSRRGSLSTWEVVLKKKDSHEDACYRSKNYTNCFCT